MNKKTKREKLRDFLLRRKLNTMGLLCLTVGAAVITLLCALAGFARTDLLILISALLVVLCFIQAFKLRKSFRTLHTKGRLRHKKRPHASDAALSGEDRP